MTTILGIAGSHRRGSLNAKLLAAAVELVPDGVELTVASIRGIPLYDGDVEAESGIPEPVRALKERIVSADGLLLVTPEYNHSVPGTLKNAIDWLSRPSADVPRVFGGRPVAVTGATPGPGGTALAQAAWLPVFRTLGMLPWFGTRPLLAAKANELFDEAGTVSDEKFRAQLQAFIGGFAEFVRRQR